MKLFLLTILNYMYFWSICLFTKRVSLIEINNQCKQLHNLFYSYPLFQLYNTMQVVDTTSSFILNNSNILIVLLAITTCNNFSPEQITYNTAQSTKYSLMNVIQHIHSNTKYYTFSTILGCNTS